MRPESELRLRLRRAGFSPIPLEGKKPVMSAWQSKIDTNAEEIELWEKVYHLALNTGVLTKFTPAIDIDILDEEAASAVEMLVREFFLESGEVLVRFGLAPKRAILLRTDKPFTKLSKSFIGPTGKEHKIEILGDGQQLAVFGLHPDTGNPYAWFGGEPGEKTRDDLPYCHAENAIAFLDAAARLLVDEHGFKLGDDRPEPKQEANDTRGHADWASLINNIHAGRELHDSSDVLAAKLVTAGMDDGAAVNFIRALFDTSTSPRDDRWQARYDDIPRDVSTARRKFDRGRNKVNGKAPPQSFRIYSSAEFIAGFKPPDYL